MLFVPPVVIAIGGAAAIARVQAEYSDAAEPSYFPMILIALFALALTLVSAGPAGIVFQFMRDLLEKFM